jgi:hypothetical protein
MLPQKKHFPPQKQTARPVIYLLNEGVFLVPGVSRAAIYDTNTTNVYSINSQAKDILLGKKSDDIFSQLVNDLRLTKNAPIKELRRDSPQFTLEFAWFELKRQ